ncbi:YceI family protein [Roseivirga sp. BDSF3-8]|uniref:YceI family protein n=1 Tax=Roseivirga sp. BDSF3-8 TaxID=3241598 RepID=UPI00353208EF
MKTLKFTGVLSLAAMLAMAGCTGNPDSDKAEVGEAQEVQEVATAEDYAINTEESSVSWVGTKPGGRHNGTFGITDGTLSVEGDKIVGGKVTIDLNAILVEDLDGEDEQKLVGHLQSPDFFAVAEYPNAMFEIVSSEAISGSEASEENSGEENEYKIANPTHKITGNLTMRGNTKSVTFPAKVTMQDGKVMAQAKFNIDRTEWGVSYGDESKAVDKAKDQFIYNTVNVGFDIVASEGMNDVEANASTETEEEAVN